MENTISEVMRSLPPGFRFHATDEELLIQYLKPKILGQQGEHYYDVIPEIDVCEFEPWQLPAMFRHMFNSKELFFFCHLKRKYFNSKRSDRTTKAGYWKVTGKERAIMSEDTNAPIGIKKTLVFYEGRVPKGKRTNWVSHEYHLNPECLGHNHNADELLPYVACRIKNKKEKKLIMAYAPTVSPEGCSSSPHAYTSNVSGTPVNQEGDHSSFCNTPDNEVADNQESVDAQPEMSVEELMESLPPLQPLDDTLLDYNDTLTYQPHAEAEDGSSSLFDFSYNNYGDELDYGYMPSPYSNFANYSSFDWGNV
ncbi:NAC domain-containing protein 71-like [Syzygium oleosum]|uniref:NAC domain-containing protein 71-like n=1 Tax=Syzygium oleosum TaxID=219896 RepID=UPI0024BBA75F|nr:NAC domain-containing protein 71-like [Syzygium oleosum]